MTRVACHQLAPVLGDLEGNRARAPPRSRPPRRPARTSSCSPSSSPRATSSRDRTRRGRSPSPPTGRRCAAGRERAAAHDLVIAGGFPERGEDGARSTTAPRWSTRTGIRAVYRKAHLWDREPECFRPGDAQPPVVDTPHGRIGLMVCYDLEFPEWVRTVALGGAELLCVPTNWPVEPRPDGERPMEVLKTMVHAATNRIAIAACDRCGTERGVDWVSGSVVVGTGRLAARRPARARARAAGRRRRPRERARQGAGTAQRRPRGPQARALPGRLGSRAKDGADHLRPVLPHPARADRPPPGHARPGRVRDRRGRRHDRQHRAGRGQPRPRPARSHDRRGRRGARARDRRGRPRRRGRRGRRLDRPHARAARRRQARGPRSSTR